MAALEAIDREVKGGVENHPNLPPWRDGYRMLANG
jgi:hypothetical protein